MIDKVPENRVREFEKEYLTTMHTRHMDTIEKLEKGEYTDEITGILTEVANEVAKNFSGQ